MRAVPGEIYPPSPVPADRWLLPGEKPFTAFGHLGEGMLDKRVFEQDVYWVDRQGVGYLLSEMSPDYRSNVIFFLHAHVEEFYLGALMRTAALMAFDLAMGRTSGEVLSHALGGAAIHELEPVEWLEATPLMRRLRALTTADG